MDILSFILIVFLVWIIFRLTKRDEFRTNLKTGDIGKVFLIANECDDCEFYVVITKRLNFFNVEVEYNIDFTNKEDYIKKGFIFHNVFRIKDINMINDSEHKYFNDGFKKRIEELQNE
jgi:hypothetical protein